MCDIQVKAYQIKIAKIDKLHERRGCGENYCGPNADERSYNERCFRRNSTLIESFRPERVRFESSSVLEADSPRQAKVACHYRKFG